MARVRKLRSRRRRRGGNLGAPLNYSLAGSAASRQSLGQGGDYLNYHEGQHGGVFMGAPLGANSDLPQNLHASAGINALDMAMKDIAGLKDQAGGRRRRSKHSKRHSKRGGKRASKRGGKRASKRGGKRASKRGGKRHSRRHRRTHRRGGSLGYATFPSQGMLLSGAQYAQAGLNPGWKDAVEFDAATMRGAL